MKKNLWKLLLVVFSMNLFVACGDDDDPTPTPDPTPDPDPTPIEEVDWSDVTGTYSSTIINLNGASASTYQSIVLDGDSEDAAVIKLVNIVPEAEEVTFSDVEMNASGTTFTFSTEQQVNETLVSIEGTVNPATLSLASSSSTPGITIKVVRKITSDVVGDWTLKLPSPVYTNIANVGTGGMDQMVSTTLSTMVGSLIAGKVAAVDISLGEDGTFGVSWTTIAGDQVGMPEIVASMIELTYFTEEGKYYMALGKAAIGGLDAKAILEGIVEQVLPAETAASLLALLEDKGGYYVLPLHYSVENGDATFYLTKQEILPLLPLLQGLIPQEILSPDMAAMLQALSYADPLDFGLIFTK